MASGSHSTWDGSHSTWVAMYRDISSHVPEAWPGGMALHCSTTEVIVHGNSKGLTPLIIIFVFFLTILNRHIGLQER